MLNCDTCFYFLHASKAGRESGAEGGAGHGFLFDERVFGEASLER